MRHPVGLIAAQSIGERGTQLAMKTFHSAQAESMRGSIKDIQHVLRQPRKDSPVSKELAYLVFGIYRGQIHLKHFAVMLRGLEWNRKDETAKISELLLKRGLAWMAICFERQLDAIAQCMRHEEPTELRTGLDAAGLVRGVGTLMPEER